MKRLWQDKDKEGNSIEVHIMDGNSKVPEDLIYLVVKKKKWKKKEWGIVMTPYEARTIIAGLFLAIDEIIDRFKLEKFKVG